MVNEFLTAKGAINYLVYRNGIPMNHVREFYHDSFKDAFKRMFPSFRIIDETDTKIEAHCVMDDNYFEIVATDSLV